MNFVCCHQLNAASYWVAGQDRPLAGYRLGSLKSWFESREGVSRYSGQQRADSSTPTAVRGQQSADSSARTAVRGQQRADKLVAATDILRSSRQLLAG